ncbi:MAG: metalloregulator ArsR/SmtB family transcription factor [Pseudomonadota bacterium]
MHSMDALFKALSDETRRQLLDRLRQRDGQTLTELEAALGMTRFGVMKHLKVLEAASLVVTHKAGRFKYHYLNAAPLQSAVDRWIEPLTRQPLTRVILDLKAELERTFAVENIKPDFILETFIRTTPEKLWEALTSAELSRRYNIRGTEIHGQFETGGKYEHRTSDGKVMVSGEIFVADRCKRLEMSFLPSWFGPDLKPSRIVYEITPLDEVTKLTILHYGIPEGHEGLKGAWAQIASSLKSLLETGEGLHFFAERG